MEADQFIDQVAAAFDATVNLKKAEHDRFAESVQDMLDGAIMNSKTVRRNELACSLLLAKPIIVSGTENATALDCVIMANAMMRVRDMPLTSCRQANETPEDGPQFPTGGD